MTDGQTLYLAFAALYLVECLWWLPMGAVMLRTWALRRGWTAESGSSALQAAGGRLSFSWPLPPLGAALIAQPWPVLPDMDGLWIGESQLRAGHRLSWAEVEPRIVEQKSVKLAPGVMVRCVSALSAQRLAAFLNEARARPGDKRKRAIEAWWQRSLSLPAARATVRKHRLALQALRLLCGFAFMICFAWLPLLFKLFGSESWRLLTGVAGLLMTTSMIAFTWRALDRRLLPEPGRRRWTQVLHLLLLPYHAIRAHDLFSTDLPAGHHPCTLGLVLLRGEQRRKAASALWRQWRFLTPKEALHPAASLVVPRLEKQFARAGLALEDLEKPSHRDHAAIAWCPRCLAQFGIGVSECESCGGVSTRCFPT